MNKLSTNFARLISTIFIPPSITLFFFTYLALNFESGDIKKLVAFLIGLFFGFVFPITMFVILRKKNLLSDNDATIKEQRTKPYIYYSVFSFVAAVLSLAFSLSDVTFMCWVISGLNTLIMIPINLQWKISAHAIGVSAPYTLLVVLTGFWFYWYLPVIILVGWSRLKLKVHTLWQVVGGTLFGIVFSYFQLVIYSKYF